GRDLVLATLALVGPGDPYADAAFAALAAHVEGAEGADDPFLEGAYEAPDVRHAPFQIEHHIGDPLTGTVIGHLAAAPGSEHGEAGIQQVVRLGARAGRIERRGGAPPPPPRGGARGACVHPLPPPRAGGLAA